MNCFTVAAVLFAGLALAGCGNTSGGPIITSECAGSNDVTCERWKYTDPRYNPALRHAD